jgi:hypothetical protein
MNEMEGMEWFHVRLIGPARNNTSVDSMMGERIEELATKESLSNSLQSIQIPVGRCFDVTNVVQLATQLSERGYVVHWDDQFVRCPCIVLSERTKKNEESGKRDLIFHESSLDVTFGNDKNGPKMLTRSEQKTTILQHIQGVRDPTKIDRREYNGIVSRFKGMQCLVLIPDQFTKMKYNRDISEEAYDEKVWYRTMRFMVSLRNHLVTNSEGTPLGLETKLVIGNSRKITQSQISVSKLKWRMMFEGHAQMMDRSFLNSVFRIRPKNSRSVQASSPVVVLGKRPRSGQKTVAGKSMAGKRMHASSAGKMILEHTENRNPNIPDDINSIRHRLVEEMEDQGQAAFCLLILQVMETYVGEIDFQLIVDDLMMETDVEAAIMEKHETWIQEYDLGGIIKR